MLLGLDHIVIAVPDLEAATKNYHQLGFAVVPGGRHPVGTYNSLISLADGSYIELISFYQANPNHRWWTPLQKGGGFVDFCMQTDDLTGDTSKLRSAGVHIDDPVPWSRTRPDGYQLKWLLSLARGEHRGVAPFLIQDETPREERIPMQKTHKNGTVGIGKITVAVEDLATVGQWYQSILGYKEEPLENTDLQAMGLRFKIGPHFIELVKPSTTKSPLTDWLKSRGPSPFAATLLTKSRDRVELDKKLTLGANIYFELATGEAL
jgi:catechol 2,3-dioxygenase-like lactoylglutathione lyase family enzyme